MLINDSEELKIKFDGNTHQIEANTFINVFLNFVSLIENINTEFDETKKIEIIINASPKQGSFILDLIISSSTHFDLLTNLFKKDNIEYAANLLSILTSVIGLAQFLKGEKPSKIETLGNGSVKIENKNGNVTVFNNNVYNIYSKPTVLVPIRNTFEALNSDSSITGFDILDKNQNQLTHISSEEFSFFTGIVENEIQIDEKVLEVHVSLNIVSMDWELKKKWEFYYMGNKISARIKDNLFAEEIKNGLPFRMGDSLEVKMEIRQQFDHEINAYVNKSYTVTSIIKHHPRTDQFKIGF
jgi:hypothetical protein